MCVTGYGGRGGVGGSGRYSWGLKITLQRTTEMFSSSRGGQAKKGRGQSWSDGVKRRKKSESIKENILITTTRVVRLIDSDVEGW